MRKICAKYAQICAKICANMRISIFPPWQTLIYQKRCSNLRPWGSLVLSAPMHTSWGGEPKKCLPTPFFLKKNPRINHSNYLLSQIKTCLHNLNYRMRHNKTKRQKVILAGVNFDWPLVLGGGTQGTSSIFHLLC